MFFTLVPRRPLRPRRSAHRHHCSTRWKVGPCWRVQKALNEEGIDYEIVKGPSRPGRSASSLSASLGGGFYPVIEFENGSVYRENQKDMAAMIRAGRLDEKRGTPTAPTCAIRMARAVAWASVSGCPRAADPPPSPSPPSFSKSPLRGMRKCFASNSEIAQEEHDSRPLAFLVEAHRLRQGPDGAEGHHDGALNCHSRYRSRLRGRGQYGSGTDLVSGGTEV